MESLRREWSGDVDLGDGQLEQLHQTYMQLISFIQGIGLEKRKPLQVVIQAPVVQTLDSAIHRINHYPADKYYGNQLRYPLDSDLSDG